MDAKKELMKKQGVVGVGYGKDDTIIVMVDREINLPESMEGKRIIKRNVGKIKAR